MGVAAAAAPLTTLRDFLELAACDSASSDGFRSYPRRRVVEACDVVEADDDGALHRSPTRSLVAIFSPRRSPGLSLAAVSRLSRTISRRLWDGFFPRRRGDEVDDERDSLGLPSPVVSSCSASECAESEADHHLLATSEEEDKSDKSTSTSSSSSSTGSLVGTTATGDEEHKEKGGDGDPAAVREQLSPVSVMDFPFDDGEEERSDSGTCECSPASLQLQRPETQQQRKIRRFEVAPVDLDAIFVAASDDTDTRISSCSTAVADHGAAAPPLSDERQSAVGEEDDHYRLLARLLKDTAAAATTVSAADERLLADFFSEAVDHRLRSSSPAGPAGGRRSLDDDPLVRAAREWVEGAGTQWGLGDVLFSGEAAVADMERPRRWMCVGEEERDVGVAVEGLVMEALLAEFVGDLAAVRGCTVV